jgi:streptogramin lyase
MRNAQSFKLIRIASVVVVGSAALLFAPPTTQAADFILTGTIRSASGEAMGGATISAKPEGGTVTTSVFTDESGNYYFPALPAGKYTVWAQALTFEAARNSVELNAVRRQDFTLRPMEEYAKQLPGDVFLQSLPMETNDDLRMQRLVRNNCTGCHTPSYILQHRFDEEGWSKIIELMKHVNVGGIYQGDNHKAQGLLDYQQKELAAYLARARGPGENGMKFKLRPKVTGEAARVVFREYDVPLDPSANLPTDFVANDGSDWSKGVPSKLIPGHDVHDAWLDLQGNLWFTSNTPNRTLTIGRIDTKTGVMTPYVVPAANGLAAQTHGMTRDATGMIWFNVNPGRGGLGSVDPKTAEISVFIPPETMSPTGGATTIDYDGKGRIWASAPDGVLRFDPATTTFTGFKSITYKTPIGTGVTYGAAADRDGNGWWAEMALDIIGKGNSATEKPEEVKLTPVKSELDRLKPEERKFYETYSQPDFNAPMPFAQGPRRMGTDKNDDVLWVGNSWGGNLARINTRTNEVTYVPLPDDRQPYHVTVDKNHNAWTNLWASDQVARYNPNSGQWTLFDLPNHGAEPRYISLLEKDGVTQVVLPYFRTRKVAIMTLRSEQDIDRLKLEATR